jgi:hypothetical protein
MIFLIEGIDLESSAEEMMGVSMSGMRFQFATQLVSLPITLHYIGCYSRSV